jgi:hypothetical protein
VRTYGKLKNLMNEVNKGVIWNYRILSTGITEGNPPYIQLPAPLEFL